MDIIRTGEIYNIKAFQSPRARQLNTSDLSLSSEKIKDTSNSCSCSLKSNSHFQDLYLASPRAQELVATMESFHESTLAHDNHETNNTTRKNSFEQYQDSSPIEKRGLVVNMADFFRNSSNSSSQCLFTPEKSNKSNDNILKIHVSQVIDRLNTSEVDNTSRILPPQERSPQKGEPQQSADSGFNEIASDLGRGMPVRSRTTKETERLHSHCDSSEDPFEQDVDIERNDVVVNEAAEPEGADDQANDGILQKDEKSEIDQLHISTEETKKIIPSTIKASKSHSLRRWHIKALKTRSQCGIFVEGQRDQDPEGELWHSTVIRTRISPRVVETRSKSRYCLIGPMNWQETQQYGFSSKFVRAFKNGFPTDWETHVKEHFNSVESTDSEIEKDDIKPKGLPTKRVPKSQKRERHPPPRRGGSASDSSEKYLYKTPSKRKSGSKQGGALPIEVELKRTSSGRLIKPPLAWWRGQRILTDGEHNLTSIEPGGEEHTPLSAGLYDFDLRLPERRTLNITQQLQAKGVTPKVAKFDLKARIQHRRKERQAQKDTESEAPKGSTTESSLPESNLPTDSEIESTSSQSVQNEKVKRTWLRSESISTDSTWKPSENEQELQRYTRSKSRSNQTRSSNTESSDSDPYTGKNAVKRNIIFSDGNETKDNNQKNVRVSSRNTRPRSKEKDVMNRKSTVRSSGSRLEKNGTKNNVRNKGQQFRSGLRSQDRMTSASGDDNEDEDDNANDSDDRDEGDDGAPPRNDDHDNDVLQTPDKSPPSLSTVEYHQEMLSDPRKDGNSTKRHPRLDLGHQQASRVSQEADVESGGQRKAHTVSEESESEQDMPPPPAKIVKKPSKPVPTKNQVRSGGRQGTARTIKDKVPEDVGSESWEEEEIFRLSEALHSLPPNAPSFWPKVSQLVETRTAGECQMKYQQQLESRNKRVNGRTQQAKPAKQDPKVTAITGGVGTLKRKRELRQLLEQHNEGYEDDIFDSTPFKKTKMHFQFPVNGATDVNDDEDDDGDYEDIDDHALEYKTPSSRTPSSRFRPLGPVSSTDTPSAEFISPSLLHQVNRNDVDIYIHRMKQGKRPAAGKYKQSSSKVVKTSTPKKKTAPTSTIQAMSNHIFDVEQVSDRDSEEEEDDYFSE